MGAAADGRRSVSSEPHACSEILRSLKRERLTVVIKPAIPSTHLCDSNSIRSSTSTTTSSSNSNSSRNSNSNSSSSNSSSSTSSFVVPILNENDSICTEELRFGDNDTLAAHCAVALEADFLFILTDVDCLYTRNPRQYPDARPVWFVDRFTDVYSYLSVDEGGGGWGTGGIHTKVVASKIATNLGVHVGIVHGAHPERILDVFNYVAHNILPPSSAASPAPTPHPTPAQPTAAAATAAAATAAARAAAAAAAELTGDGDASESESELDDDLTGSPLSEQTEISSKKTNPQKETFVSDQKTPAAHAAPSSTSQQQQQQQQQQESQEMPDSLQGSSSPAAAAASSASQGELHPQPDLRREYLKDTEGRQQQQRQQQEEQQQEQQQEHQQQMLQPS
ncbi:hypothetical protein Emed_007208 [Eimeria media]